jgi:hypothetical protein
MPVQPPSEQHAQASAKDSDGRAEEPSVGSSLLRGNDHRAIVTSAAHTKRAADNSAS